MDLSLAREWFGRALVDLFRPQDSEQLLQMFDSTKAADWKDPMRLFLEPYKTVVGQLMSDAEYVDDACEELAARLLETGDWEVINVTSPSLGYPRKWYSFKYEIGDGMPLFGTSFDLDESEWDKAKGRAPKDGLISPAAVQLALARTCWVFDRVFMDINLIPEAKAMTERDPKEPFIGKTKAAQMQRKRLATVPLLYMSQYCALWPRMVDKINTYATTMAKALYPRDVPALDVRNKIRTEVLNRLPLHPLLATFASLFSSSLQLSTYFGTEDCLLVPNTVRLPTSTATEATGRRSGLAQMAVAAALAEQLRLSAVASSAGGESWVRDLLGDIAPNVPRDALQIESAIVTGTGFAGLMESLIRLDRYTELMPALVQQLGWKGGKALTLSSIEAAGADFVLSNGDYMSDTPIMVLAGLRPALPIANAQVLGFSRRFATDFNTGPCYAFGTPPPSEGTASLGKSAIVWSTVTCKGWLAMSDRDDLYSRFYMPAGMSMGEEGGEARWNIAGASDPIGKRVADYYRLKSPGGYVRSECLIPPGSKTRAAQNLFRYATDWDLAVESVTDAEAAQTEMLTVYGPSLIDRSVELLRYRDSWNMRIPVRLARCNTYLWLNEVGNVAREESFDGHVAFDDTLELHNDVSAIDALLDLMPVHQPRLAAEIGEQVKSPE